MTYRVMLFVMLAAVCCPVSVVSAQQIIQAKLRHLRVEGEREWDEFPVEAEGESLDISFSAQRNEGQHVLRLRQQDVKQVWSVRLNGSELGRLPRDENDMVIYFPIPSGSLRDGQNQLTVKQTGRQTPDDIRVGEIAIFDAPLEEILNQGRVEVEVRDSETQKRIPCRLTIIDSRGALVTVYTAESDLLAVRPGIVYSGDGRATFGLPPGDYTIYAGRGFEWSLETRQVTLTAGQTKRISLSIAREVPTEGYVCCDTHVHTFTHSRHGDATIQERMITLAGEGIELPIATDHNLHIDYESIARKMGLRQHFTPVIGNEVTTKVGHFNIFPVRSGSPLPNYKLTEWEPIFASIYATENVRVVILNHARDLHGNFRPFGPERFNSAVGQNVDGWRLQANAMELINSGAIQTDPMRLYRDWMATLNRGLLITPVGSSDSHDVGRHFVGQARTYIRCDDGEPGKIHIDQAVDSFVNGRVNVSYGLLAEIQINDQYGPGDLAPQSKKVLIDVRVLGPSWIEAQKVELYANGHMIREAKIADGAKAGVKWSGRWTLENLRHDVHLVAVARGPALREPYWTMAKPYQPTSPRWQGEAIGSTGAVWIDSDGDGRRTSAYDYARRLFATAEGDLSQVLKSLAGYDEAVAAQAASLLQNGGVSLLSNEVSEAIQETSPATKRGFQAYIEAWRECQLALPGSRGR